MSDRGIEDSKARFREPQTIQKGFFVYLQRGPDLPGFGASGIRRLVTTGALFNGLPLFSGYSQKLMPAFKQRKHLGLISSHLTFLALQNKQSVLHAWIDHDWLRLPLGGQSSSKPLIDLERVLTCLSQTTLAIFSIEDILNSHVLQPVFAFAWLCLFLIGWPIMMWRVVPNNGVKLWEYSETMDHRGFKRKLWRGWRIAAVSFWPGCSWSSAAYVIQQLKSLPVDWLSFTSTEPFGDPLPPDDVP